MQKYVVSSGESAEENTVLKSLKALRMFRLLRMLKLLKIQQVRALFILQLAAAAAPPSAQPHHPNTLSPFCPARSLSLCSAQVIDDLEDNTGANMQVLKIVKMVLGLLTSCTY